MDLKKYKDENGEYNAEGRALLQKVCMLGCFVIAMIGLALALIDILWAAWYALTILLAFLALSAGKMIADEEIYDNHRKYGKKDRWND